jgi:hypothetical protein
LSAIAETTMEIHRRSDNEEIIFRKEIEIQKSLDKGNRERVWEKRSSVREGDKIKK